MPAWGHRFDPATIKALTVYIHVNAGRVLTGAAGAP